MVFYDLIDMMQCGYGQKWLKSSNKTNIQKGEAIVNFFYKLKKVACFTDRRG